MDAVTSYQAANNLSQLIDNVVENVEPTIVCNDDGNKAVLMGLDEFNAWQETFYLLSNPANAAHLQKSIAELEQGLVFEKQLIEE
ncbi:MAG: antitoxin [Methylococcaceae bacterium]|nr:antitoxin [Methylococcaceae bacterium]